MELDQQSQTDDKYLRSCINMLQSKTAIFVLSRNSVNDMIDESSLENMKPDSLIHQLLFEMRFAMEIQEMGYLECGISVICVGDMEFNVTSPDIKPMSYISSEEIDLNLVHYGLYFSNYKGELMSRTGCCHPSNLSVKPVASIEEKLREALNFFHLGAPIEESKSVQEIISSIISNDSFFVAGPGQEAWESIASDIYSSLSTDKIFRASSRGAAISRPTTSASEANTDMSVPRTPKPPPTPSRFKKLTARNKEATIVYAYDAFEAEGIAAANASRKSSAEFGSQSTLDPYRDEDYKDGDSEVVSMLKAKVSKRDEENKNLTSEVELLKKHIEMLSQDVIRLRYLTGIQ